jgi:hypothetical protein
MLQAGPKDPCPCGSGKKFKRCHGQTERPETQAVVSETPAASPAGMPAGFDPSKLDPGMMAEMSAALQRLPRGQLVKMQTMMQRAMAGQDVTKEAMELERMLPPGLKEMAGRMNIASAMGGAPQAAETADEMSLEEAKRIVEQAKAQGKITEEAAAAALTGVPDTQETKGGISKLWKKVTGK